jgi:glycerophosphoryl diester phosphodiesterase
LVSGAGFKITKRRLITTAIVGVIVAVVIGFTALNSVRLEDNVQIMAHRGSSQAAPENTLASIQKAIDEGADWVEIDVQETADDEVVVLHDSDFMKLAGRNLKIWDATLDDLQTIDIGSWFAPEFADQRVPTLGEVLDLCKGKVGVNIELKYYGHDKQLEQRVADIVRAHDMDSEVMAMSLKMEGARKMKSIRPNWKVGLLMSVSAGDLKKIEADFLAVNAGFVDRGLVRAAHNAGKEVYVWTVNDAPSMSNMIGRGVDGLLTDKPSLARVVLQERAEMSAPQRLLLELASLLGVPQETGQQ